MVTARIARWCLLLLSVFLLAYWVPQVKDLLFEYRFGKTDLFYSPVIERFVYTELVGRGHQFVYRDQDGNDYGRTEFESLIPFIYYKNMELRGKLPLELDGERFDKAAIRAERLVLELDPVELPGHAPRIRLYPLLEANPGRARLRFPEDIMRPGAELTFIGSDANRVDPMLTRRFTKALADAGFRFPVQAAFGRASILKPFDAGWFLLDGSGALFHLKRVDNAPQVAPVPLPEGVDVRHLKIAENKRGEHLGLLLAEDDRVFVLGQEDYRLTPLELPSYDPDRMELKIIFNPLYRTAIYSDQRTVHAVAMDRNFAPIDHYSREMAMAEPRLVDRVWQMTVPFSLELDDPDSRYRAARLQHHGAPALIGVGVSLMLGALWLRSRGLGPRASLPGLLLVALTGVYGLIAIVLIPPESELRRAKPVPNRGAAPTGAAFPPSH